MADYIKSSLVANAKTYEIFNKKNETEYQSIKSKEIAVGENSVKFKILDLGLKESGQYAFTVKVHADNFPSSEFSNIINYEVFKYYVNAMYIDEAEPEKHLVKEIVNEVLCCGKSEVESMVDIVDKFKLNNIEGYSFKNCETAFDDENNKIDLTYYYVSNTVDPENPGGEEPDNPGDEIPETPDDGGDEGGAPDETNTVVIVVEMDENLATVDENSDLTVGNNDNIQINQEYILKATIKQPGSYYFDEIIVKDTEGNKLTSEKPTYNDSFEYKYTPDKDCSIQVIIKEESDGN